VGFGPHSYDPGISPTLLTWTVQVPHDAVVIDLDAGTATLNLHNICVHDVFTVPNSFDVTHAMGFVGAVIKLLQIQWSGVIESFLNFSSSAEQFAGNFYQTSATISLTTNTPATSQPFTPSAQDGFQFVADPSTTVTNWAQIGKERNGLFFS
jgi:hypothetical protein